MANYVRKRNKHGTRFWYCDKKLHREDGPAIEWSNGDNWWYLNGQLHNDRGPAIISATGEKEWWLFGKQVAKSVVDNINKP